MTRHQIGEIEKVISVTQNQMIQINQHDQKRLNCTSATQEVYMIHKANISKKIHCNRDSCEL